MKKKIFCFILLVLSLISSSGWVQAEEVSINKGMKVQYLIDNKIVLGRATEDEKEPDYALDKNITRAEISKLLVNLLDLDQTAEALKGTVLSFTDVQADHWASGYINALTTENLDKKVGRRVIVGFPNGKFLPEKDLSYEELGAMLVRICKKDLTKEDEEAAIWATSYMKWAKELGLLEDISYEDSRKRISREDAFVMVYNAREILGMNTENSVDFGDRLGIVSKFQAGILEVNQDRENLYTIDEKTIFAQETRPLDLYKNMDLTGSLIRFIVDENNHVDYIMELGNPRDLGLPGNWQDLAEKTVSARKDTYFSGDYTGSYEITVAGVKAEISKDTKLFAADEKNNILGPIKDPGQVFENYVKYRRPIKDVYMGYTSYGTYNEANIIVFNSVDLFQGKEELRRIITPITSDFKFTAESMIGGQEKVFDLMEAGVFPGDLDLDFMDVILMRFDSYENARLLERPKKLIDYKTAPIFKVQSYDERVLVLRDQYNRELPLTTRQTAIFKPGQLKVGDHVQVLILPPQVLVDLLGQDKLMDLDLEDFDLGKIDFKDLIKDIRIEDLIIALESIHSAADLSLQAMAISIVPDDLRGALPLGFRNGDDKAYVKDLYDDYVILGEKVDGVFVDQRAYKYLPADRNKLKLAKDFDLALVYDQAYLGFYEPYLTNVDFYFDYEALGKLTNQALEKILAETNKNKVDLDRLLELYRQIEGSDLNEDLKDQVKNFGTWLYLNN